MKIVYFIVFFLFLLFHTYLCKKSLKNYTGPFAIYGFVLFLLLVLVQLPILKFDLISLNAVGIYILTYCVFFVFSTTATRSRWQFFENSLKQLDKKIISKVFMFLCIFYGVMVFVQWGFAIKYFGSIGFMLGNSMAVRVTSLENQIYPIYVTYPLCIGFAACGLGSYLLFFSNEKLLKRAKYLAPIVLTFLSGLTDFSRMGLIMHIFMYIAAFFTFYSGLENRYDMGMITDKIKKSYKRWMFVFLILAVVILILPKMLRDGGNYTNTELAEYTALNVNNFFVVYFLHLFEYISGPIVAFGKFLDSFDGTYTYGVAFFRPIIHLLDRLDLVKDIDYELVYDFVYVPFSTNIFTYLREAYTDFGMIGVAFVPFLWGNITKWVLRKNNSNIMIKFACLQFVYVYILFGFFYTPYSQGGITIGMFFYIVVTFLLQGFKRRKND